MGNYKLGSTKMSEVLDEGLDLCVCGEIRNMHVHVWDFRLRRLVRKAWHKGSTCQGWVRNPSSDRGDRRAPEPRPSHGP